jgi:hypothetical protein
MSLNPLTTTLEITGWLLLLATLSWPSVSLSQRDNGYKALHPSLQELSLAQPIALQRSLWLTPSLHPLL